MKGVEILILDDERSGVQHLHDALSSKHSLSWCRNIHDAMHELEEKDYDLIICGVHLVHESMFDFLRQVKRAAFSKGIPFICFRAVQTRRGQRLDANVEATARVLGADAYLVVEADESDAGALLVKIERELTPYIASVSRNRPG